MRRTQSPGSERVIQYPMTVRYPQTQNRNVVSGCLRSGSLFQFLLIQSPARMMVTKVAMALTKPNGNSPPFIHDSLGEYAQITTNHVNAATPAPQANVSRFLIVCMLFELYLVEFSLDLSQFDSVLGDAISEPATI